VRQRCFRAPGPGKNDRFSRRFEPLVNTSLMAGEENGKERLTRLGCGDEFF
jgi:hypothetical protein